MQGFILAIPINADVKCGELMQITGLRLGRNDKHDIEVPHRSLECFWPQSGDQVPFDKWQQLAPKRFVFSKEQPILWSD